MANRRLLESFHLMLSPSPSLGSSVGGGAHRRFFGPQYNITSLFGSSRLGGGEGLSLRKGSGSMQTWFGNDDDVGDLSSMLLMAEIEAAFLGRWGRKLGLSAFGRLPRRGKDGNVGFNDWIYLLLYLLLYLLSRLIFSRVLCVEAPVLGTEWQCECECHSGCMRVSRA